MKNNDLISRAAAIDALTNTNLKRNVDSLCDGEMNRTRRAAQRVIAQLPAVDAAPVIHAHWIEYYTDIMCSHCHATYKDEIVDTYQDSVDHRRYVGLEYCPHCGSIMDGGDE